MAPNDFLKRCWGFHVRRGGNHADVPGFPPQRGQKLPHLRRPARHPREGFEAHRRFRHRRGGMFPNRRFDRRTMRVEGPARPPRLQVCQGLDPTRDIRSEITMDARFGSATQPPDVAVGHPLAALRQRFHPALEPWVGMRQAPVAQRVDVHIAERDPEQHRAPSVRVAIDLTMPTRAFGARKSQRKPYGV